MNDLLELPDAALILDRCSPVLVDPVAERQRWLDLRTGGLGGSDIGPIFGLSPYASPMEVWAEKTKRVAAKDLSDSKAVKWGTVLEDTLRRQFSIDYGVEVFHPKAMFFSRQYPHLFVNTDGLFIDHDGVPTVLEVKTAGFHMLDDWANEATPPWYVAQAIHYAALLGYRRVLIYVLIAGQDDQIRKIDVTPELAASVITAADAWWTRHILNDEMPPVDHTEGCRDVLGSLWKSEDIVTSLDRRSVELAAREREIAQLQKDLKKERETIRNELRSRLGKHRTGTFGGRPILTWNPARQFDEDAFKKAHPHLHHEYSTGFEKAKLKEDHPALYDEFCAESDADRRLLVKPDATTIAATLETTTP